MTSSAGSIGLLVGGLIMSVWGGQKKRIHAVNMSFILWGLFGAFLFGPAWSLPLWLVGSFLMAVFNPIINSAYIAILQAKVEPDLQGRIFGLENAISTISFPLGQLAAGWLADNVFEPAMMPSGILVGTHGSYFGIGRGAGIGVVIFIAGVKAIFNGLLGYLVLLPDHVSLEEKSETRS